MWCRKKCEAKPSKLKTRGEAELSRRALTEQTGGMGLSDT